MSELITDYTLKTYIARIIRNSYDIRSIDITAIDRNEVISSLWRGILHLLDCRQPENTDNLLELLHKEYGSDAIKDNGLINSHPSYEIRLSNVRFFLVRLPESFILNAGCPPKRLIWERYRRPEDIIAHMNAFNESIPQINGYIEQNIAAISQDNMICSVTAATAKGIISQLVEEDGLDIPKIAHIRCTENGRVAVYFADTTEKINCPLNYLRARFLRRFCRK